MRPVLSQARCEPLHEIEAVDERGQRRRLQVPHERGLTVYVDRAERVTLMTLGAHPEWLVVGWLLNQGLVAGVHELASVQVDWDLGAAAVLTRAGPRADALPPPQLVTTGCGQGSVLATVMERLDAVRLPSPREAHIDPATLRALVEHARAAAVLHRQAGSVHSCALFRGDELLFAVEDVGRHNAVDTIAGWMALNGVGGGDKVFYTTGRLTSEMVVKAAQMGIPIVVSRNGVTRMGHELGQRLGLALFGRAAPGRFLCYCGAERLVVQAEPA